MPVCFRPETLGAIAMTEKYSKCILSVVFKGWNELSMNLWETLEMFSIFLQESSVFSLKMNFICIKGVDELLCLPIGNMSAKRIFSLYFSMGWTSSFMSSSWQSTNYNLQTDIEEQVHPNILISTDFDRDVVQPPVFVTAPLKRK